MLQFPINWTTETGERFCEIKLDSEWKIIIFAEERVVEIRRNDTSEEVYISGTLTLHILKGVQDNRIVSEQVFSRFMKAGSLFENIYFNNLASTPFLSRLKYRLHGNVIIFNTTKNFAAECKKCVHMKSLVKLSNDFEGMSDPQNGCFADLKLKCGSESIPAYKIILSSRSSVFAAMFKNAMRESHQNEVDIKDMDVSVLRVMLNYIYTGKTPDLTVALASDLLFAADKYQLQDLKRVCCDFLKNNLSLQNVLNILVLGDMHSENELKYSAISYICNKCKKFSYLEEMKEWKTVLKERPALAMEVLISIVKFDR